MLIPIDNANTRPSRACLRARRRYRFDTGCPSHEGPPSLELQRRAAGRSGPPELELELLGSTGTFVLDAELGAGRHAHPLARDADLELAPGLECVGQAPPDKAPPRRLV